MRINLRWGRRAWLGLALLTLFTSAFSPGWAQTNGRIPYAGTDLHLSGANVAWVRFAADIGPGTTQLATFDQMFADVAANGGNSMRLWLHTNGANTPEWSGDRVVGPGVGAIEDLRAILDLAQSHDVGLMLTLWSFDMVRASFGTTIVDRSYGILTNQTRRQEYIDNALIPMVDALKDHPAILAWEIFNEPEGMSREFGWTDIINSSRLVPMSDIQAFVNQTTGAIKRTDPDVMVTNGAWAFYSNSDIFTSNSTYRNYYRDDRLIAAGGDPDGTLDFYTVHYYSWGGTTISPFHHDVDYWGLDKEVAITEFYLQDTYGVGPSVMYETLYDRGYAGAMGWQWFGQGSNWTNSLANMRSLAAAHPEAVALSFSNPPPPPPPGDPITATFSADPATIDLGATSTLSWSTTGAASATLDGQAVALNGSRQVSPAETTTYTFIARSSAGESLTRTATVSVIAPPPPPPPPAEPSLTTGKVTTASSVEAGLAQFAASSATDGDAATRWSSEYADAQTLTVDLGAFHSIEGFELRWEAAYGLAYQLQTSLDGQQWSTVFTESAGNGGIDAVSLASPAEARYVRFNGVQRATQWGYSLFEFNAFGQELVLPDLTASLGADPASIELGQSATLSWSAPNADAVFLDGQAVSTSGSRQVSPGESTSYLLLATDRFGRQAQDSVRIEVTLPPPPPPPSDNVNRALGKSATATSVEAALPQFGPGSAFDGDPATRWSSEYTDAQSLTVDLDSTFLVNRVALSWEAAYGGTYAIELSTDGASWSTAFTESAGDGGLDEILLAEPAPARYVRLRGIQRATQWGYSIWEMEVYGEFISAPLVNVALGKPATATSVEAGLPQFAATRANDGDPATRWSSTYSNSQRLSIDLQQEYTIREVSIDWEVAYGQAYAIEVSTDGSTWTSVFTEDAGDGGNDRIVLDTPVQARHVRMRGIRKGTQWGYSIWEMQVLAEPMQAKGVAGDTRDNPETDVEAPMETSLLPNYPNPFNPTTTIAYRLAESGEVTLEVFDMGGRRVATLQQGMRQAGEHRVEFDGAALASGTYLVRLHAGNTLLVRSMTLIK